MFGKSTLTSLLVTLGVALVCAPVTVQAHPMSHVLRRQDGNDTSSGNTTQLKYTSPKLCDPDVKQYSGYLDAANDEHYFFWFFESKNDPKNDPLTIWLNGGPGCSSLIGLWEELGPCQQNGSANPHSWHHSSNMLFFDQPDGVGFSYGKQTVSTTEDAAERAWTFLQAFYETFPQYSKLDVHYFGESYGGHYIPGFASHVVDMNKKVQSGEEKGVVVPLKSIGVGNGFIDAVIQYKSYPKMTCHSSYPAVLSEEECDKMQQIYENDCKPAAEQCAESDEDSDCVNANQQCGQIEGIYAQSGYSFYDIRQQGDDTPHPFVDELNKASVIKELGARGHFSMCSDSVGTAFAQTGDGARSYIPAVEKLLKEGIPVLIYVGDADVICNWYGNLDVVDSLKWDGSDAFSKTKLEAWKADGKEVGQFRSADKLTFVRVYEAGHEVPMYQPEAALSMFQTWISGKSFG
ncbi:Putative Prepro-carboxypeptidase Z [Lichtheimia ramosa]|uniref:Putative Prepro-carboxypeptidase Z n=1 Tax=Lichtheimia ramosa TaxID=688394 RepID=A0A077WGC0_9FUNG|nr:Putative Prepro-carboxypeptidase Z [Lichtheimia ramosa]